MLPVDTTSVNDAWGAVHELRYRQLLTALDLGWQIEEPVYLRPRYGQDGPRVYHFLMRRGPNVPLQLIVVPECSEVETFVEREGLRVQAR